MRQGYINENNTTRDIVTQFGGLNHTDVVGANEFYDMRNMTMDYYPLISARKGLDITIGGLNLTDAIDIVYTGYGVAVLESTRVGYPLYSPVTGKYPIHWVDIPQSFRPYAKKLVMFGTKLVIMPGMYYLDTTSASSLESVNIWNYIGSDTIDGAVGSAIEFINVDAEFNTYNFTKSATAPASPTNGQYWLDTTNNAMKKWSSAYSMWVSVATSYMKIKLSLDTSTSAPNDWIVGFKKGDVVFIEGIASKEESTNDRFLGGTFGNGVEIVDLGYDSDHLGNGTPQSNPYIIVKGLYIAEVNLLPYVRGYHPRMIRKIPHFDSWCVSNNRMWGCFCGSTSDTTYEAYYNSSAHAYLVIGKPEYKTINEIYCSKLGDINNWYDYSGVSTDSYAVSVGDPGKFTGCIENDGVPYFFKENKVMMVYGNYPASYQLKSFSCIGNLNGNADSLVAMNGNIYYASRRGIMQFNGSSPILISAKLGDVKFNGAKACVWMNKLIVSLNDANYTYDIEKNMWCKQNDMNITALASDGECGAYILSGNDIFILGSKSTDTLGFRKEDFDWELISGRFGLDLLDNQYYSRINIRFEKERDARVSVSFMYDSSGNWEDETTIENENLGINIIPLIPRRCNHFQIKIEGKGAFKLYSISKTIEEGSDGN